MKNNLLIIFIFFFVIQVVNVLAEEEIRLELTLTGD